MTNTSPIAEVLTAHIADTLTMLDETILVDCSCGAEIEGVLSQRPDSTVGAVQAIMAAHLAAAIEKAGAITIEYGIEWVTERDGGRTVSPAPDRAHAQAWAKKRASLRWKDSGEPLAPVVVERRILTGAWAPVERPAEGEELS